MRSLRRALLLICLCFCSTGCVVLENVIEIIHPEVDLIGNDQDNLIEYSLPIINDESVYVEIADTDESEDQFFVDLKLISKAQGTVTYTVEITSINNQKISNKWQGEVLGSDMIQIRTAINKAELDRYSISEISAVSFDVNGYKDGSDHPFVTESASVTLQN